MAAAELWGIPEKEVNKAELPKIRASSDLAWGLWNRVPGSDLKNINMFMSFGIVNHETATVIIPRALKAAGEPTGEAKPWPGTDIIAGHAGHKKAALALIGTYSIHISASTSFISDCTHMLTYVPGCPNALGAGYFLLQHKRQLGGAKFIWKIKIFKGDDLHESDDPHLIFYVDPNPPPMPPPEDTPGSPQKTPSDSSGQADSEDWMEPRIVKRSADGRSMIREHIIRAKL